MILSNFKKRLSTSLFLFFIFYLIAVSDFILATVLLIFGVLSVLEFFNINNKISKNTYLRLMNNILFVAYIFILCVLFFIIFLTKLKIILIIILCGCIASDIGGFIIGKIFKGPKLSSISPKKTISGALGSIFFSIITINSFYYFISNNFSKKIIITSILISVSCQLGDLFFSFLKRKAKLKDTGNFLPGHGGILDRIDGILLGIPVGFLILIIFY